MTNDLSVFNVVLPDNIRETELFVIAQELVMEARSTPVESLATLENQLNPASVYADSAVIGELIANNILDLGGAAMTLPQLITLSSILFKRKGTAKALQLAFDSFDVPFVVLDSDVVNADPEAYGMPRPLECEILVRNRDPEDETLDEEAIKKVKHAFDLFGWICVDPIYVLSKLFTEDSFALEDSIEQTCTLSVADRFFGRRMFSEICPGHPDILPQVYSSDLTAGGTGNEVDYLPNLAGEASFQLFAGTPGPVAGSITINQASLPYARFKDFAFEMRLSVTFHGTADCVIASQGNDLGEPLWVLFVAGGDVIYRVYDTPSTFVDHTATPGLGQVTVLHNLVKIELCGVAFHDTPWLRETNERFYLGGGHESTPLANTVELHLTGAAITLDGRLVYQSGPLVSPLREDTYILGRGLVAELDAVHDWYQDGSVCDTNALNGSRIVLSTSEPVDSRFAFDPVHGETLTLTAGPEPGDLTEVFPGYFSVSYYAISTDSLTDPLLSEIDANYAEFSALEQTAFAGNVFFSDYALGVYALTPVGGTSGALETLSAGYMQIVAGAVTDSIFTLVGDYLEVSEAAEEAFDAELNQIVFFQTAISALFILPGEGMVYLSDRPGISPVWNLFLGDVADLAEWRENIRLSPQVSGEVSADTLTLRRYPASGDVWLFVLLAGEPVYSVLLV